MWPCEPAPEITFEVRWQRADGEGTDGTLNCYSADDLQYNNLTTVQGGQRIFSTVLFVEFFPGTTGRLPKGGQQQVTISSPYFAPVTRTVTSSGTGDRVTVPVVFEWNRDTNQARFK